VRVSHEVGNRRFRELVAQSTEDYNTAQSRAEKCGIVEAIKDEIAKSGGSFLTYDESGTWLEMEPEKVRQKIAHAIRDRTKANEVKKARAVQLSAAPLTVPTMRVTAAATTPPPDCGISSMLKGLDNYRKGLTPAAVTAEDDDVKMPTGRWNAAALPQKRTTEEEMILDAVPRAHKRTKEEMMLSEIGDGLNSGINMRPDNRFELRSEESIDGPWYPPGALKPDVNAVCSSFPGPTPQGLRGLGGIQGQNFLGLLSTQEISSVPEVNQVTPNQLIPGDKPPNHRGHDEDPPVVCFYDDDFLSRINQLPGLSDADPPFH
jgi:hypothetical protein